MNWIKENKFLTGFFAVMLVGVGGLGYLVSAAMGRADDAANRYTETSTELGRLQNLPVSANKKNLDVLIDQKKDAIKAIAAFQTLLASKSFSQESITPEQFQDKLKATKNAIVDKAQGATKLPDKFFLGFDVYETRPPDKDAAAPLAHELKAIDWILGQIIDSRVTELKTIKRDPLPEESGKVRGDKKGKSAVTSHSLELTMQTRQPALASFLNSLVSEKAPQFYSVKSIRLKNQNDKGPARVDPNAAVNASQPAVNATPATPGAPAAPDAALKVVSTYIVGEEQLEVTLQIDIVDFAEPTPASAAAK